MAEPASTGIDALVELYRLVGEPGYRAVADHSTRIPGVRCISSASVGNLLTGATLARSTTVESFIGACISYARSHRPQIDLPEGRDTVRHWADRYAAARSGSAGELLASPVSGVRVRECNPRSLGVHASIDVVGALQELPTYVERDTDRSEIGLRAKISAAAKDGGFVLIVGGSSVGKTRSAYEAVRALVPDRWLLQPTTAMEIRKFALKPTQQTVIWLDKLDRYVTEDKGLTSDTILALLKSSAPVIVIGMLWPAPFDLYSRPESAARGLIDLATVIHIGDL